MEQTPPRVSLECPLSAQAQLESWKQDKLKEYTQEIEKGFQIRFG